MNQIETIEQLIEQNACYSRPLQKFILDNKLIGLLHQEVLEYVDTFVSFETLEQRKKLSDKITIGSLRQITKRLQDNEDYWEILSSLELHNLGVL